ncbi:hypothetical protein VTP01DRAFT_9408 [Rhizomucor pusillus]|uniref:uncharacterized protein n=1 Tax=Rhizomucor pusillus TaxID=4840 RepID=UPI0037428D47
MQGIKRCKTRKPRSSANLQNTSNQTMSKICKSALSKHCSKTVDLEKFKAYLKARSDVAPTLSSHYQMLIFRKLRFRRYLHRQRADDRLAKYLRSKFGQDLVLVIGDWSMMAKFHVIGLLRLLKKKGFEVYLLDEFKTLAYAVTADFTLQIFNVAIYTEYVQYLDVPMQFVFKESIAYGTVI